MHLYTVFIFKDDRLLEDQSMIARIIMSEHPDAQNLQLFTSDHAKAVCNGFLSNTEFSISVQTSATSLLVISGYKDQRSADSNLEARQKWFDDRKGKYIDTFYYEGDIKTVLRGGGQPLIEGLNTETFKGTSSDNNILKDELRELKAEISEVKEMIKLLKSMK